MTDSYSKQQGPLREEVESLACGPCDAGGNT